MAAKFKPQPVTPPEEPQRPSSAELRAAIGPLASNMMTTSRPAPEPASEVREPTLMMSFKATKSFARLLAGLAEQEGGLRKVIARLAAQAGYEVPDRDLHPERPRRTYD